MFENSSREEVDTLLQNDSEFRVLYQRHKKLDSKVNDAEVGALPMDGTTLSNMKREKLQAKEQLTQMWSERRPSA